MSEHINRQSKLAAALLLAVLALFSSAAALAATSVSEVRPNRVQVAPGKSVTLMLRGTDLDQVRRVMVYENRRPSRSVTARFVGRPGKTTARLSLSARPNARPGANLEIVLLGSKPVRVSSRLLTMAVAQDRRRMQAARGASTTATRPIQKPQGRPAGQVTGTQIEKPRPGNGAIAGGPGQGISGHDTSEIADLQKDRMSAGSQVNTDAMSGAKAAADSRLPSNPTRVSQDSGPFASTNVRSDEVPGSIADATATPGTDPGMSVGNDPSDALPKVGNQNLDTYTGGTPGRRDLLNTSAEDAFDQMVDSKTGVASTDRNTIAGDGSGAFGEGGEAGLDAADVVAGEASLITALDEGLTNGVGGKIIGGIGTAVAVTQTGEMIYEDYKAGDGPDLETGVKVVTVSTGIVTGLLVAGPPGALVGAAISIVGGIIGSYAADADAAVKAERNATKEYEEGYIPPEDRYSMFSPLTAEKLKEAESKQPRGALTNKFGNVTPDPGTEYASSAGYLVPTDQQQPCAPEGDPRAHCQHKRVEKVDASSFGRLDPGNIDPVDD